MRHTGDSQCLLWADAVDQVLAFEDDIAGEDRGTAWTLTDHQGTVRDLVGLDTDEPIATSKLLQTVNYNSFGLPANPIDWDEHGYSEDLRFFYTGQQYDVDTGLQYSRARYYDPLTREWISEDPIGFAAGDTNLYRRVKNSPANATDPSGNIIETPWDVIATLFSAGVVLWDIGAIALTEGHDDELYEQLAWDSAALGVDLGLLFTPGAPAGAGVLTTAARIGIWGRRAGRTFQAADIGLNAYQTYRASQDARASFDQGDIVGGYANLGVAALNGLGFGIRIGQRATVMRLPGARNLTDNDVIDFASEIVETSPVFRAKLAIHNLLAGGRRVSANEINDALRSKVGGELVEWTLSGRIDPDYRGNFTLKLARSRGYFGREVAQHELLHLGQFLRDPELEGLHETWSKLPWRQGARARSPYEWVPALLGSPTIYIGVPSVATYGVYVASVYYWGVGEPFGVNLIPFDD